MKDYNAQFDEMLYLRIFKIYIYIYIHIVGMLMLSYVEAIVNIPDIDILKHDFEHANLNFLTSFYSCILNLL